MSVFLKIKIKSLAAEAKIIKREEDKRKVRRHHGYPAPMNASPQLHEKFKRDNRAEQKDTREISALRRSRDWYPKSAMEIQELHLHRINVVRKEARLAHIAYAMVRNKAVHDKLAGLSKDDEKRIINMVKKYGGVVPASPTGISTPRVAGSTPASVAQAS